MTIPTSKNFIFWCLSDNLSGMKYSEKFILSSILFSFILIASSCATNTNQTAVNQPNGDASRGSSSDPAIGQGSDQKTNYNQPSSSSTASQPGLQPPILPDAKLTPGDTLDVTKEDICVSGYSKKVRDVPQAVKEQAYKEYGITQREPGEYEIDHLISLELGGSNSIKNLWPESYRTESWNARTKDQLENKLHEMICSGQIDIKTAQHEIAANWIDAYKKYIQDQPRSGTSQNGNSKENGSAKTKPSSAKNTGTNRQPAVNNSSASTASNTTGAIVGNKNSHIYHLPNCPDYDKVSAKNRVEFQSAKEAEAAGYRLAGNCRQK